MFDVALLRCFDSKELEYLIAGLQEINVKDWKANTSASLVVV